MTVLQYVLWLFMCFCFGGGVGALWTYGTPKTLHPLIKLFGSFGTLIIFWCLYFVAFC